MEWKDVFEKTMSELEVAAKEFPWEDPKAYSEWLAQTYFFVVNSTRILALAGARTPLSQNELHQRFIEHANEEKGHEKLLLKDLTELKRTINTFQEKAPTAALYKTQYFWIEHRTTDAFMGWVVVLEAFAAKFGPYIYSRTKKAHGEKASLFLKVHAHEDQDHIEKAYKEINNLPKEFQNETVLNFLHCAEFYKSMLRQCWSAENSIQQVA